MNKIIHRRNFIKTAAKSSLFLLLMNPLEKIYARAFSQKDEPPQWQNLVEIARWCPTVHNLQPHKLKIISPEVAELHYDPSRLLPYGDPKCIFSTIAMGIFIEHLSIVAASANYKVEIEDVGEPLSVKNKDITYFCKLRLLPNDQKEILQSEHILKRKTSRLKYDGDALNEEVKQEMAIEAKKFNHDFYYSDEEEMTDFIIQLNQETLFEDLDVDPVREELDRLFRYSEEEAEKHKDGLWSKCMGFSGKLMKSVFQKHEKWEKGARRKMLSNYYKNSFKGTKTIGWFAGHFENTDDWLNAGRMLSRNWLILTKGNAYLHPFGSLITNEKAYKSIQNKLDKPEENKKIWMIFRAGNSHEPTRSYRLSTEEIIIS